MSCYPCGCDPEARHGCDWFPDCSYGRLQRNLTGYREHLVDPREERIEKVYVGLDDAIRHFESGATRNIDSSKFDYEGFLNPEVLHAYGEYMHEHRHQRDGSVRDSDNWQKGIPFRVYVKSLVRHVLDLWRMERGYMVVNPDTNQAHTKRELCCAIMFNAMGYLKELVDPSSINRE